MSRIKNLSTEYIKYLFKDDNEQTRLLKYDNISLYSITPFSEADKITEIMKYFLGDNIIVTDMTACIGGNAISFGKTFKHVNVIEICKERYKYLKYNMNLYNLKNISYYNDNCLNIINTENLEQDYIFIDPAWGGRNYKYKDKLDLYLSGINLYNICNNLYGKSKLISLKVPNNFNIEKFKKKIIHKNIKIYKFLKLQLIILQNNDNLEESVLKKFN